MARTLVPAQTPRGDAAESYATRDNIGVPGAFASDDALTSGSTGAPGVDEAAATRATERAVHNSVQGSGFAPDEADYSSQASERGTS
jgi:hypothetical protein